MKETEAAMKTLKDKKCASGTTCKTDEECEKAYFVVQAHHDHCAADEVPKAVAADLHDFESSCSSCSGAPCVRSAGDARAAADTHTKSSAAAGESARLRFCPLIARHQQKCGTLADSISTKNAVEE